MQAPTMADATFRDIKLPSRMQNVLFPARRYPRSMDGHRTPVA